MDYMFYGKVTAFKRTNTTTVSLQINCEPDETLDLYELSPDASQRLVYSSLLSERHADHVTAQFEVLNDRLFLFIIAGQSNDGPFPFEVTYAVYNGEVIPLPENNIVYLAGATYVCPDGRREIQR